MIRLKQIIFTLFLLSAVFYSSAQNSDHKNYADYKDWQLNAEKPELLSEWENLELNFFTLTADQRNQKITILKEMVSAEIESQNTFEFEDSKTEAAKSLLSAFEQLENAVQGGKASEISQARTITNLAFINYENLQVNIRENSMHTLLFLFTMLLVIMLLFIFTTLFFSIRLKKSREKELETSGFNQKILEAQENERKRLSLELHDTIAQNLRAVQLLTTKAFSMENHFFKGRAEKTELADLKKQVLDMESKSILDIRTLCYNLTPPDLDRKDLKSALEHYCSTFKRDTGIECSLVITEDCNFSGFTSENQLDIFRLVQEALTNAAKHSEAEETTVVFRTKSENGASKLLIFITDDGKGFNLESAKFLDSHFGLKGMKERAKFLGGSLKINTAPGEGTEVQIEIPLQR